MKLMLRISDNKILNTGEPPWSNEASLSGTYTIVDIGDTPTPPNPTSYFYNSGMFTYDTTEDTTETNFRTALKTLLSSISGKHFDAITATEVRKLVALLVHEQFRGIDRQTGNYKPINQWVR